MPDGQLSLDYTLDPQETRVLTILRTRRGKDLAITIPDLASLVQIGERQLQKVIRRLVVEHGEPILSGTAGIWYAATAEELLASYREQRRKGISTLQRARANYRRHLARLQGQQEIAA